MKKKLISLLILILIVSTTISIEAATTGAISLALSSETVKPGESFSITVTATDSNNINTIEYSSVNVTDKNGNATTAISVDKIEAIGDNWYKVNNEGKTDFIYSGGATQSQKVFKVTLTAKEGATEGEYNINVEGLKVYSTNVSDDTTNIGTKTIGIKIETEKKNDSDNTANTPGTENTTDKPNSENSTNKPSSGNNTGKPSNSNKKLPQTGSESTGTLIVLVALVLVSAISYISFSKYKNV